VSRTGEDAGASSICTFMATATRGKSARKHGVGKKAEEKAQELKAAFDPAKQLERELEAKIRTHDAPIEIANAVDEFLKEVDRLNRGEATRSKYALTLSRLSNWCATQKPPVLLFSQLDVPTLRRWIGSWNGAPTTRHNHYFFSIFASNKAGSRRILPRK
jgi:hypothetical protein